MPAPVSGPANSTKGSNAVVDFFRLIFRGLALILAFLTLGTVAYIHHEREACKHRRHSGH